MHRKGNKVAAFAPRPIKGEQQKTSKKVKLESMKKQPKDLMQKRFFPYRFLAFEKKSVEVAYTQNLEILLNVIKKEQKRFNLSMQGEVNFFLF